MAKTDHTIRYEELRVQRDAMMKRLLDVPEYQTLCQQTQQAYTAMRIARADALMGLHVKRLKGGR
jgi:hypothetical protein